MGHTYITENKPLVKDILLIDGIARAGKFFLGKIVAGIKDVEYFQAVNILEYIPPMCRNGVLSEDAAIALLKATLDEFSYNMRIGRNLNLRQHDASSIYNAPDVDTYLNRAANQFGEISSTREQIIDSFQNDGIYSTFIVHEVLPNIELFYRAYPDIKILHLSRHPVDIIHSWHKRQWGWRWGKDPLSFTPVIKGDNCGVPWYACDWKEEYESSSDLDRVIKSVVTLFELNRKTYSNLSSIQRKQVKLITYEDLVEKTQEVISSLCVFLGREVHERMPVILKREKCPGEVSLVKRAGKRQEIQGAASRDAFDLMMDLSKGYEQEDYFEKEVVAYGR